MKNLIKIALILSIAIFSFQSFGHEINFQKLHIETQNKIKHRKQKLRLESEFLKISTMPEAPLTQDEVSLFIQPLTGFTDSDILIELFVDNINVTSELEHPATELWVYNMGVLSEVKSHNVKVKVFIQDSVAASQLVAAIQVLDTAIADLNEQIANATDPNDIAQLTAIRDEKINQKNQLAQDLIDLRSEVTTQEKIITVSENPLLSDYPRVFSIDPRILKSGTIGNIQILGENFTTSATVKVGTQTATVQTVSATQIVAQVPAMLEGVYDLEIKINENDQIKNTILKNAIVVSNTTANPNTLPTAVAVAAPTQVPFGEPAYISGLNSFDTNNNTLRYEWRIKSAPEDAGLPIDSIYSTQNNFEFIGPRPGYYIFELIVVQETGLQLSSVPSQLAIRVLEPANTAPVLSPMSFSLTTNSSQSIQASGSDAQFWQELTLVVTIPPTLGTVSIDEEGVVTFTSGSSTGSENFELMLFDSGKPALFHKLSIPVTVN